MKCIYCSNETQVINSRPQKRLNAVWRRRRCLTCQAVFTTVEHTDLEKSVVVKHPTGLQPFLRDKLLIDVYNSLKHRETALGDATALTDTVIGLLLKHVTNGSIDRTEIISVTSKVLKRFDKTAATYFVAYHPL